MNIAKPEGNHESAVFYGAYERINFRFYLRDLILDLPDSFIYSLKIFDQMAYRILPDAMLRRHSGQTNGAKSRRGGNGVSAIFQLPEPDAESKHAIELFFCHRSPFLLSAARVVLFFCLAPEIAVYR